MLQTQASIHPADEDCRVSERDNQSSGMAFG